MIKIAQNFSSKSGAVRRCAFSLIEILVTVALLSVIILGLVAMFNQTRRAFTSSMTQVDVLEAGRTAADLIARELEQMTASSAGGVCNFFVDTPTTYNNPILQPLTDPNDIKTNNLQEVYFLTRNNQQWSGIGYRLTNYADGIGTLFRYSSNNIPFTSNSILYNLTNYFTNTVVPGPNFSRLIDGVVDFRVRAYNTNGVLLPQMTNSGRTILIQTNVTTGEYTLDVFNNGALPAYVEVELGVLEDRALARYQALSVGGTGPGTPARAYLASHAGQVHIFRQRIPIRNVNPAAYP